MINIYYYVSADYDNGIIISNRPLRDSELFEVRITDIDSILVGMNFLDSDKLSIEVGITTLQPDTVKLPETLYDTQSKTWWMSGRRIWLNQEILTNNYGILNSLKVSIHMYMCSTSVYAYM